MSLLIACGDHFENMPWVFQLTKQCTYLPSPPNSVERSIYLFMTLFISLLIIDLIDLVFL